MNTINLFLELDAVAVFGGGMIRNEHGRWRTTRFEETGDNFGVMGDYIRVLAAKEIYKKNPKITIITIGSKGQFSHIPDAPTLAELLKQELIEHKIPKNAIVEEKNGGNTYQQIMAIAELIKNFSFKKIGLVSNQYHIPRIRAMIEYNETLKKSLKTDTIIYLCAEEILIELDHQYNWKEVLRKVYESKTMKERVALENKGVKEIVEGRYKYS